MKAFFTMSQQITIIAYGSLCCTLGLTSGQTLVQSIQKRQPLAQILEAIGISGSRVQLVMVNHRPAPLEAEVAAGDRVALFPREYPIFVDWHAFRHGTTADKTGSDRRVRLLPNEKGT